ncbi:MAG: BMP family ABC transporter substrate-binding protein, partial [Leifsonia flava]
MGNRLLTASVVAVISVAALVGCAEAPSSTGTSSDAAGDYCARMVTNSGGLEDRSFNQSSWAGLQKAEKDAGIEV